MTDNVPTHALTRPPGASYVHAISSSRQPIDVALARTQHAEYCQALVSAGLNVETLPPDERFPDSCFMQDPALVIAGQAIIGRMGAPSRRGEEESVCAILGQRFPLHRITPPGCLEGGDVMLLPDRVLVGQTDRTNAPAIAQLGAILAPHGLSVAGVPVAGYLHLLSAAMYVGRGTLLVVDALAGHPAFAGLDAFVVPPEEEYAANSLGLGRYVIVPASHPQTARALRSCGFEVLPVPMSEFYKADGGVTCLSLVWHASGSVA